MSDSFRRLPNLNPDSLSGGDATVLTSPVQSTSSSSSSRAVEVMPRSTCDRAMSNRSSVNTGVGRRNVTVSDRVLPDKPGDAILVLHDAVEEHAEKTAVHQPRRPFVDQREGDPAAGLLGIEVIEPVLGKARVVGADVGGMVEIDPPGVVGISPIRGALSRRSRGGQLAFPFGELREHGVHRRVGVFQRKQQ